MIKDLKKELKERSDPGRRVVAMRYFKTGHGEYGEGDVFIGLAVPDVRRVAKAYKEMSLETVEKLLQSKIHEERLAGLFILMQQFEKATPKEQRDIYNLYMRNTHQVNNWDLVDLSAPKIVGPYLWHRKRAPLRRLIKSKNMWDRRIAILATFYFISKGEAEDALEMARAAINDKEDLIHKAGGWMLREVGSRVSMQEERDFLNEYAPLMPRVMLRYAIEKMPIKERKKYLSMKRA